MDKRWKCKKWINETIRSIHWEASQKHMRAFHTEAMKKNYWASPNSQSQACLLMSVLELRRPRQENHFKTQGQPTLHSKFQTSQQHSKNSQKPRGWKEGSAVKSPSCSPKWAVFSSQHSHQEVHNYQVFQHTLFCLLRYWSRVHKLIHRHTHIPLSKIF